MRPSRIVLGVILVLVAAGANVADAGLVRTGDQFKIRIDRQLDILHARTEDAFPVTVPEGLQVDPHGAPEIPRGTMGAAALRVVERSPAAIKFDVQSITLTVKGRQVVLKTTLAGSEPSVKALPIRRASLWKKLLLPPGFGFLIWKDTGLLPAGREFNVEVTEDKRWPS